MNVYVLEHNLLLFHSCGEKFLSACIFLIYLRQIIKNIIMPTVRNQETQQFMEIIDANKQLISKVCLMYARDHEHFKDLYQEVMATLWQGMKSFSGESKISTWIYRVALNTCVTYYRRHNRADSAMSISEVAEIADCSQEHASLLRQMYALISQLEPVDKGIIMMWLDSSSYDDIADVTGLTRANVASRIHRIRQRLIKKSNE